MPVSGMAPFGMPLYIAGAVLGSAVLHASWNAAAKAVPGRLLASLLIGVGSLLIGGVWSLVAPMPAGPAWPYLLGSAALQTGYILLLTAAYAHGEFRQMYPLARGIAPVLVTAFSLVVLGERLAMWHLAGIALVVGALGVLVSVGTRGSGARGSGTGVAGTRGYLLAIAAGVVIASYTVVDGLGVRLSETSAGYAAWQMLIHGPMVVVVCVLLAGRKQLGAWFSRGSQRVGWRIALIGVGGGILSGLTYAIVLWAQARASLSLVSALRETSVLFAGILGALFFAEKLSARQMLAAAGVVCGIILIQVA
ncbi:MAG: DMT family transporter [Nakamurella sp.]